MKKILLFLLIKIYIVFPLYPQTNVGFKAGVNLSTLTGKDATIGNEDPDLATLGVVLGIVIKNDLNNIFWQSEVDFINKGAKWSVDGEDEYFKYSFDYLQLVTGPSINFKHTNIFLNLNFYGAYLLSAKAIMYDDGDRLIDKVTKEQLDELNSRFDFGLSTGFEFITSKNINAFFSYNLGLINFLNSQYSSGDIIEQSIRHSGFQLGIKYYINN